MSGRHQEQLVAAGVKTVKIAVGSRASGKRKRKVDRIGSWVVSPHVSRGRSIGCCVCASVRVCVCGRTRRVARPCVQMPWSEPSQPSRPTNQTRELARGTLVGEKYLPAEG